MSQAGATELLTLYKRHLPSCKQEHHLLKKGAGRFLGFTKKDLCACPIWIEGQPAEGKYIRRSLKTDSKAKAERIKHELENGKPTEQPKSITIKDALDAFVSSRKKDNLNPSTLSKYELLAARLRNYATCEGIEHLDQFTVAHADGFRASWRGNPRTLSKTIERLRALFRFFQDRAWIATNPAKAIKAPEVRPNPTLPFTDQEVRKLLASTDNRSNIFFRVLLHTGLRIIDAAQLRPEKIIDGRLFLYTQKTGAPVFIPLPPDLLADLSKLPLVGGFFFAVQSENPVTIAEYYRVRLEKAAIAAGLMEKKKKGDPRRKKPIHPHRFRDTFAVNLLLRGVSIETVAILLGNTIRVCERHYSPWVKARQDRLELEIKKTWTPPQLVRVK